MLVLHADLVPPILERNLVPLGQLCDDVGLVGGRPQGLPFYNIDIQQQGESSDATNSHNRKNEIE